MATPEQIAIGKLDGRDPDTPNYVPLDWAGVSLNRPFELGDNLVTRPAGADPGKRPGEQWWSTSTLDHATVVAENTAGRYRRQPLIMMVAALFAHLIEELPAAEIRAKLGLPEPGA